MSVFYRQHDVPVHSVVLLRTHEAAVSYPRGDIDLAFCGACGFISNVAYDPSLQDYSSDYEASQAFSPTFGAFAVQLARRLVADYGLYGKTIVEIGCGQGEFLNLLCALGDNRGVGFDPAYVPGREDVALRVGGESLPQPRPGQVEFVADYYSEAYADRRADLVVCRMTLEHIDRVGEFVRMVRRSLEGQPNATVFFQVPDVTRVLHDCAFWDVYYEHCSYFAPASLARLFQWSGFQVLNLTTEYDGQYLMIEARPDGAHGFIGPDDDVRELAAEVRAYSHAHSSAIDHWRREFAALQRAGRRAAIWGAGSKGVAFLTTLGLDDAVGYAVDINPNKHGTFMAGTGHEVVAPEFLVEYRPDTVVVMNPVYRAEIATTLAALGLTPRLLTV